MPQLSLPLSLLCLLAFTSACYIQNCPRGGKRSFLDTGVRQCMTCGPQNRGQCFGANICCGEDIGCYIGTSETLRCQEENYLPSPCEPAGRPCGKNSGKCASPGICCTDETCATDYTCLEDENEWRNSPVEGNHTLLDSAATNLILRLMRLSNRQAAEKHQLI